MIHIVNTIFKVRKNHYYYYNHHHYHSKLYYHKNYSLFRIIVVILILLSLLIQTTITIISSLSFAVVPLSLLSLLSSSSFIIPFTTASSVVPPTKSSSHFLIPQRTQQQQQQQQQQHNNCYRHHINQLINNIIHNNNRRMTRIINNNNNIRNTEMESSSSSSSSSTIRSKQQPIMVEDNKDSIVSTSPITTETYNNNSSNDGMNNNNNNNNNSRHPSRSTTNNGSLLNRFTTAMTRKQTTGTGTTTSTIGTTNDHHDVTTRKQSNNNNNPVLLKQQLQQQDNQIKTTTQTKKDFIRDPIYIYSSLLAGIGSGIVSGTVCSPLDLIKTRMQVWGSVVGATTSKTTSIGFGGLGTIYSMLHDIIRTDGIQGCFRGLTATLLTVPAFWGCYFPLYEEFKRYGVHHYNTKEPAIIHMTSAVAAGAISDVVCNPMFVVRTRLQTEAVHNMMKQQQAIASGSKVIITKLSMIQTMKVLYNEGGIFTFWRGMTANLLGLSHVAIQFPAYEFLKKTLRHRRYQQNLNNNNHNNNTKSNNQFKMTPPTAIVDGGHDKAIDLLIASALSKMIASIMTYPHEVVRSRMMDVRTSTSIHRLGFIKTCQMIYAKESIAGFYCGLPLSLIRVIPNTCLTFITYEFFLRYAKQQMISSYRNNDNTASSSTSGSNNK